MNLIKIVLFLFINIGFAQSNTIAIYKVKKNDNKNNYDKDIDRAVISAMNKAFDAINKLEYLLIYNDLESSFKIKESIEPSDNNFRYVKMAELIVSSGNYYQNKVNNITLHQFEVFGEQFLVHEPLNKEWNITNIKKQIGKYTCFKAILNCASCDSSMFEFWFAPEIPIPFGPRGFGGLPGLIVEVKMGKVTLFLDKIIRSQKDTIKRPKKGKSVTLNEYKEIALKLRSQRY